MEERLEVQVEERVAAIKQDLLRRHEALVAKELDERVASAVAKAVAAEQSRQAAGLSIAKRAVKVLVFFFFFLTLLFPSCSWAICGHKGWFYPVPSPVLALDFYRRTFFFFFVMPTPSFICYRNCLRRLPPPPPPFLALVFTAIVFSLSHFVYPQFSLGDP